MEGGKVRIGEVLGLQDGEGYVLCHHADAEHLQAEGALKWQSDPIAALDLAKLDEEGMFRSLKSAPNLRRGWALRLADASALRQALDYFYPAAVGLAMKQAAGTLSPVALRTNLARQTGMYRFTNTIRDDQAVDMVARCCDSATKCLRRITWDLAVGQPLEGAAAGKRETTSAAGTIPLLCIEVCPHLVSEARKIAQKNHAEQQAKA